MSWKFAAVAATALATVAAFDTPALALNPQPLPPRWVNNTNPGSVRALNPQPLPPRWSTRGRSQSRTR